MDENEARSWAQAIADTAIRATQGGDLTSAAETIETQLAELWRALDDSTRGG